MSPSPAAHSRRSPSTSYARSAVLDNAKYLLITLVILGHILRPSPGNEVALQGALWVWIYLFHMPAFALVAGHLTGVRPPTAHRYRELVMRLLIPYLIFNSFYVVLDRMTLGSGEPFDLTEPYWLTWFLLSLFWWRLLLPVILQLRYPVATSVVISLVAGLIPGIGSQFSASRTLSMLPFFVLGAVLTREQVLWRPPRGDRLVGALVLAGGFVAAWALASNMGLMTDWVSWKVSYAEQGLDPLTGLAIRALLLGVGVIMTFAFLSVIPRARTGYTLLGAFTIYPYLLHGLVVRGYRATPLPDASETWVGLVLLIVVGIGLTAVLSMEPVRRRTRFAVEPRLRWFFVRDATPVEVTEGNARPRNPDLVVPREEVVTS